MKLRLWLFVGLQLLLPGAVLSAPVTAGDARLAVGHWLQHRPAADCLFDGWYADPACLELVSTSTTYSFLVVDPEKRVYAKFSTRNRSWTRRGSTVMTSMSLSGDSGTCS